jgi:hypothetical protein
MPGDDGIAFCHLDKTHHPATTLSIADVDGHDLLDVQNRRFRALTRKIFGIYGVIDGTELPIRRGLAGKIRLKLVDLDKGEDLLEVEIPWRPAPSQSIPKQKGRGCATEFAPTARNGHRSWSLRSSGTDDVTDRGKRLVRVGAQGGDRSDADHDDEGQHHGVFDSRRAVFRLEKRDNELSKLPHDFLLGFRG